MSSWSLGFYTLNKVTFHTFVAFNNLQLNTTEDRKTPENMDAVLDYQIVEFGQNV